MSTWYVRLRPTQLSGVERNALRTAGVFELGVMSLHDSQWDEHRVPDHWEQSRVFMVEAETATEARQIVVDALQRDLPPTLEISAK